MKLSNLKEGMQAMTISDGRKIQGAHRKYIELAESFLTQVKQTADHINQQEAPSIIQIAKLLEIDDYLAHGARQIDQIRRRVLQGEVIPNNEKYIHCLSHTQSGSVKEAWGAGRIWSEGLHR